jgi:hypothetical protein
MGDPSLTRRVMKNTANHVGASFKTMKSATSKLTRRVGMTPLTLEEAIKSTAQQPKSG